MDLPAAPTIEVDAFLADKSPKARQARQSSARLPALRRASSEIGWTRRATPTHGYRIDSQRDNLGLSRLGGSTFNMNNTFDNSLRSSSRATFCPSPPGKDRFRLRPLQRAPVRRGGRGRCTAVRLRRVETGTVADATLICSAATPPMRSDPAKGITVSTPSSISSTSR